MADPGGGGLGRNRLKPEEVPDNASAPNGEALLVRSSRPAGGSGFHLLDIAALVVGYGLASMLIRAFLPGQNVRTIGAMVAAGIVFTWLGLAMTGPIVLLLRRVEPDPNRPEEAGSRTWAEVAWLVIGFYWTTLTVLIVPVRLPESRLMETAMLGLFPIAAAIGLRFFGPTSLALRATAGSWTHRTALALLISWPVAWICLVALAKTIP